MSEMQFNEVSGSTIYLKSKDFKAGDLMIEGLFKKTYKSDKYDSLQHEFSVEEKGKVVVNGSRVLDNKLADVNPNSYVKLFYKGMGKSSKGKFAGKEFHDYQLLVATNSNTTMVEKSETVVQQTNPDESFLA